VFGPLNDHGSNTIYVEGIGAEAQERLCRFARLQVTRRGTPCCVLTAQMDFLLHKSAASLSEVHDANKYYKDLASSVKKRATEHLQVLESLSEFMQFCKKRLSFADPAGDMKEIACLL